MDDLKNENECLKRELHSLADQLQKSAIQGEEQNEIIRQLNQKIRFLEGQIEAYQYCMNCRR